MKLLIILIVSIFSFEIGLATDNTGVQDREYTIRMLQQIADPVLNSLSRNQLKKSLPRRTWETRESNFHTTYLQAFGRTLSGMAPWLALGEDQTEEGLLRKKYADLALQCLIIASDPNSPDFLFDKPTQEIIVHTAYIAYPLLIAPQQLWDPLTEEQRTNIINVLKLHRDFIPNESNWLLFPSIIESAIWTFTGECSIKTIEYAVNKHMEWYVGDGTYGDGAEFHWDYYNSYVIHPLLIETIRVCKEKNHPLGNLLDKVKARGHRYAEILEHLISPEGTFPVMGRSSVYRIAYFQQIGYMGMRYGLTDTLEPGATRAALTTAIKRMMEAPGTFDEKGWLHAGIVGKQEDARDNYNYTGALYMCTMGLTHLGIPADSPFWTAPVEKWFQQRIWSGEDILTQYPYHDRKE